MKLIENYKSEIQPLTLRRSSVSVAMRPLLGRPRRTWSLPTTGTVSVAPFWTELRAYETQEVTVRRHLGRNLLTETAAGGVGERREKEGTRQEGEFCKMVFAIDMVALSEEEEKWSGGYNCRKPECPRGNSNFKFS